MLYIGRYFTMRLFCTAETPRTSRAISPARTIISGVGDESAQLNGALVGLDLDLHHLQRGILQDRSFDLGSDRRVIAVFAHAVAGLCLSASNDRHGQCQCDSDSFGGAIHG